MSVRFLVYIFATMLVIFSACTKTISYDNKNRSTSPDIKNTVSGNGVLDSSYLGRYKVVVENPTLFGKTVFLSSKCSEYEMQILFNSDGFLNLKNTYKLSMGCMCSVDRNDTSMMGLVWQENIRHALVSKKTYFDKTYVMSFYDINTDFIYHNYNSVGTSLTGVTTINYSAYTLIDFYGNNVKITLSEKDVNGKQQRVVVASGFKMSDDTRFCER